MCCDQRLKLIQLLSVKDFIPLSLYTKDRDENPSFNQHKHVRQENSVSLGLREWFKIFPHSRCFVNSSSNTSYFLFYINTKPYRWHTKFIFILREDHCHWCRCSWRILLLFYSLWKDRRRCHFEPTHKPEKLDFDTDCVHRKNDFLVVNWHDKEWVLYLYV